MGSASADENAAIEAVLGCINEATNAFAMEDRTQLSVTPSRQDNYSPHCFADEDVSEAIEKLASKLAFVHERTLDLSGRGLQKLTPVTVSRLSHLSELKLSMNPLENLPSLAPMSSLRELHMNSCKFKALPEGVGGLRFLQLLSAEGCGMEDLPSNALAPEIRILALGNNALKRLPRHLSHRPLEKVLFNDNQLEDIEGLSGASTLQFLNLERNRITKVPKGILHIQKLSCLSLAGNPLSMPDKDCAASASATLHDDGTEKLTVIKAAGEHPGLRGATPGGTGASDALVIADMGGRKPLGSIPSLEKTSEDLSVTMQPVSAALVMKAVAEAMCQAHSRGVAHGDLVAHRVLVDPNRPESAQVEIFAKGFRYPGASWRGSLFECIEVRAWGELFCALLGDYNGSETSLIEGKGLRAWKALAADCLRVDVSSRPRFSEVVDRLNDSFQAPPPPPPPPS